MIRDHNINQVRRECEPQNLEYDDNTNWTNLPKLIKQHKKDPKYFKTLTVYDLFKLNETYYGNNN